MLLVRVEARGQRVEFAAAADATGDVQPLLEGVSDWFERGSCAQVPGHEQGETPSATVTLANPLNATLAMFDSLVGARVTLYQDGDEKIRGTCVRCALGPSLELSVEI